MPKHSLQTTMMFVEIGDCNSYAKESWNETEWRKKRSSSHSSPGILS